MIDKELAREAVALLGTAVAMLVEDAHLELVTIPADVDAARALAVTLRQLGADVEALGTAAAVLARQ